MDAFIRWGEIFSFGAGCSAADLAMPCMLPILFQVKTDKGKVEGTLTTDGKVVAFKGIPFAAPPVGGLRWQPPQPAAKWKGVRATKDFGSRCVQTSGYPDMIFHDPAE